MNFVNKLLFYFFIINYSALNAHVITNPYQRDGFGSQFQSIIAAAVYADVTNQPFIYTPFKTMEHNYDNDPDFLARKEQFINFIDNFEVNTTAYKLNVRTDFFKRFFDTNITVCAASPVLKKIKTIFRANKDTDYFKNGSFNVAVHIRRPNQDDCRLDGADTPDRLYVAIIDTLRALYADRNPLFHLYSQGVLSNFTHYQAADVVFHLNESVEDTFLGFVFADLLVTSRSSFSYTAALLSDGIVYYIPFWHNPLPHWISTDTLFE